MTSTGSTPTPPISKKVIVGFLTGIVTTGILAVATFAASHGVHIPQGDIVLITGAAATGTNLLASYIVKEETSYLEKALAYLKSLGL